MIYYDHSPILLWSSISMISSSSAERGKTTYSILRKSFDPDLCRNTMKYRNTHKRRDAAEIRLHFINNKWLKYAYRQNRNKLARALVAYLWEEMWRLLASELCYNEARRLIIIEKQWKTLNIQIPNPRRWNAKTMGPVWVSWYINFPGT